MECCGVTTAALLSAFAAWKWRSRRSALGDQLGELADVGAMMGTRTRVSSRMSELLSGPRGSQLQHRRSMLHQMSRKSIDIEGRRSMLHQMSRKSVDNDGDSGTKSFHTCISRTSDILNSDDLDEVIEFNEEATRQRDADLEKIAELRSLFDEVDLQDPRKARWLEDNELLRYVRARPTLNEGEALLKKALVWRCEQEKVWGVDLAGGSWGHMYETYQNNLHEAPDWWAFLYRHLHCSIYGEDAFNIPISYVNFGNQDLQGAVREVGSDALVQFMVYFTDSFLDSVRTRYQEDLEEDGSDAMFKHGGIVIIDLEGLSWRHKGDIGEFSKPGNISKFLHVERQRRSFVVRAPRIFTWIYAIVSPMIDVRAREKMRIIGVGDSIQPMIDEIGIDLIPECIGGTMPDLPVRPVGLIPEGAFEQFKKEREEQRRDRQQRMAAEKASGANE